MIKFGKGVVKLRIPILVVTLALMIPSVLGMAATRINYDIPSGRYRDDGGAGYSYGRIWKRGLFFCCY